MGSYWISALNECIVVWGGQEELGRRRENLDYRVMTLDTAHRDAREAATRAVQQKRSVQHPHHTTSHANNHNTWQDMATMTRHGNNDKTWQQ
jgi:hypothetical protein